MAQNLLRVKEYKREKKTHRRIVAVVLFDQRLKKTRSLVGWAWVYGTISSGGDSRGRRCETTVNCNVRPTLNPILSSSYYYLRCFIIINTNCSNTWNKEERRQFKVKEEEQKINSTKSNTPPTTTSIIPFLPPVTLLLNLLPSTSPSTISLLPSILFFPISWVLFCGVIFTKSWEVFRGWPLTLPPPVHQALDPSILCLPPEILSVLNVFLYSPYFFLNPPPPFVFIGRAPLITCLFLLFYVLNSLRPFPKISLFNYIGLIPVRSIWGFHLYALCWLCIIFFFVYLSTNIQFNSSDSRFTQQELPACKPILTPKWVRILQYFAKLPIYVY